MEMRLCLQGNIQNEKSSFSNSRNLSNKKERKLILGSHPKNVFKRKSIAHTRNEKINNAHLTPLKTERVYDKKILRESLFDSEVNSEMGNNTKRTDDSSILPEMNFSHRKHNDRRTKTISIGNSNNMLTLTEQMNNKLTHNKGKSILFKILQNSKNNTIDLNPNEPITRHHQTRSMTEKITKIPKLNLNDENSFFHVIANLPTNTRNLNRKKTLQLNNELRKLKTCDVSLSNPNSPSKYTPKISKFALTETFKNRVLKEAQILQEDSKRFPTLNNANTNQLYYTIDQDDTTEIKKRYNKSNTKVIKSRNEFSKFKRANSVFVQQEHNAYEKLRDKYENVKKEKIKSKLRTMDKQLRYLSKEDYGRIKEGDKVNIDNLNRVIKFYNVIKFDHNEFVPSRANEEIEPPEKISNDELLSHEYFAKKTLGKLGPAKYVKTQFKTSTIRKFFENKGMMGNI